MTINLWGKPKKPKAADSCEAPAGLIEALLAAQNGTLTTEMWNRLGPAKAPSASDLAHQYSNGMPGERS